MLEEEEYGRGVASAGEERPEDIRGEGNESDELGLGDGGVGLVPIPKLEDGKGAVEL